MVAILMMPAKVKRIINYAFLILQKLLISVKKMLMSAELKGCVMSFTCSLDLLQIRYNCDKFHLCRIFVTDFMEVGLFASPSVAAPKRPILNRVKLAVLKPSSFCLPTMVRSLRKLFLQGNERLYVHAYHFFYRISRLLSSAKYFQLR